MPTNNTQTTTNYVTGKNESVPVIKDDASFEDPVDAQKADTDGQLGELKILI
jgi:hypothetical protein